MFFAVVQSSLFWIFRIKNKIRILISVLISFYAENKKYIVGDESACI